MTLFMAEEGICYEYSGRENVGTGWHPAVLEVKFKAEEAIEQCGLPRVTFNAVQLNRYEGGWHTLGYHSDDEPDIQRGAPIASVSFGATRDFHVKDRGTDDDTARMVVPLADGAFFVMGGAFQQHYLHAVPAGGSGGLRLNLTFRVCVPRAPRLDAQLREGPLAHPARVARPPAAAAATAENPRPEPAQSSRMPARRNR